jgi:hypothetical protein
MDSNTLLGILGMLLIFFSIYILYFMEIMAKFYHLIKKGRLEFKRGDEYLFVLTLIGLVSLVSGTWLLTMTVTWEILKIKIVGLLLFLIATFLVFLFPDSTWYQPPGFTTTAVFAGLLLYAISLYLLIFR